MMKMGIKLDVERIRRDGKYDIEELWKMIDKQFANACTKEVQADGCVMYVGIPDKDYFTNISLAYSILKSEKRFTDYCIKWIWYDNDEDETLPFSEEDILLHLKESKQV